MRETGKITFWDDDKGYGFVEPHSGSGRIFIHVKAFANKSRRPEINQVVSFALSADKQGRPCAVQATLAGDRPLETPQKESGSLSIALAISFLIFVAGLVLTVKAPLSILAIYLSVSTITFFVYWWDKSAAQKGRWRTQESTLHLLALAGGWPGALVAQQKLRHKSKKQSFRAVFWITVVANCVALYWLMTPVGSVFYKPINAIFMQILL